MAKTRSRGLVAGIAPEVRGPYFWQVCNDRTGGTRWRKVEVAGGGFHPMGWERNAPHGPGLYDSEWRRFAEDVCPGWPAPWTAVAIPPPPVPLADAGAALADLRRAVPADAVHCVTQDAEAPRYGTWPAWVAELRRHLPVVPERPYLHQQQALEHLDAGEHVAIATGTASGKSLCYQLAILKALGQDPDARALYVSPAKALCDDQMASWRRLLAGEERSSRAEQAPELRATLGGQDITVVRYDRGTKHEVWDARDDAHVVLTNSSMLHWMLAQHDYWQVLLGNLRLVVLDEVHQARGIAGAQLAWVIRRLRRLASIHGEGRPAPQLVLCSATIGNPAELGSQLIGDGRPVREVKDDASGHGHRLFVSWTAPTKDQAAGRTNAVPDLVEAVQTRPDGPLQTIVFGRSRGQVSPLARYCAERLTKGDHEPIASGLRAFIAAYREDRKREILAALRGGDCSCVFSTSALELGVDIGDLSVAVIAGIPHNRAGFRQMAGRAGRRPAPGRQSMVLFLPRDNPLDDWFAAEEHFATDLALGPPEPVLTDSENDVIAFDHIAAAARELPLDPERDGRIFGQERLQTALARLRREGRIEMSDREDSYYWTGRDDPHARINILGSRGTDTVSIRVKASGEEIGEVDNWSALWMLFPGAIYEDGIRDTYVVESLHLGSTERGARSPRNSDKATAWLRPANAEEARSHTVAATDNAVRVLQPDAVRSAPFGSLSVSWGRLEVSTCLQGFYWQILPTAGRKSIHEVTRRRMPMKAHPTALSRDGARVQFDRVVSECEGLWFALPEKLWQDVENRARREVKAASDEEIAERAMASLHGAEHAICKMTPTLKGFCEDDIAGLSVIGHDDLRGPGMFLYEGAQGGVGLVDRLLAEGNLERVIRAALASVAACPCPAGCPRCVMDRMCGNDNFTLDKEGSRLLLEALVEAVAGTKPGRSQRKR